MCQVLLRVCLFRMFSANSMQPHASQPHVVCWNIDVWVQRSPHGTNLSGCWKTALTQKIQCCAAELVIKKTFLCLLEFIVLALHHLCEPELSVLLLLKHKMWLVSRNGHIVAVIVQLDVPRNDLILLFVLVTSFQLLCFITYYYVNLRHSFNRRDYGKAFFCNRNA